MDKFRVSKQTTKTPKDKGESAQAHKSFLNMAGEFAVASELNRRSVLASVTYGASKAADIFAVSEDFRQTVRIQVKATDHTNKSKNWVLGKTAASVPRGDVFWVLVYFPEPDKPPEFFVLSDSELYEIWKEDHEKYCAGYRQRNHREFQGLGVPVVGTSDNRVLAFRDCWNKIAGRLQEPRRISVDHR
jgi:hypothetical protein